jgi:hypothetical protein
VSFLITVHFVFNKWVWFSCFKNFFKFPDLKNFNLFFFVILTQNCEFKERKALDIARVQHNRRPLYVPNSDYRDVRLHLPNQLSYSSVTKGWFWCGVLMWLFVEF